MRNKNEHERQIAVPAGSRSQEGAGLKGQMPLDQTSIFNPPGEAAASLLLHEMKWQLRERQINRTEMLLTRLRALLTGVKGPESASINSHGSNSLKASSSSTLETRS